MTRSPSTILRRRSGSESSSPERSGEQSTIEPPSARITSAAASTSPVPSSTDSTSTRLVGGLVTAYLQDSQLRGLLPAGVSYVVGGQAPGVRQVVPGLSVTATRLGGAHVSVLRLLAPGGKDGTAAVTFLGAGGDVTLPGTTGLHLAAGTVLDVPLGGLPAGDYTAVVDADVPVVAGALLTRGAGVGLPDAGNLATSLLDRAWAPAVAPGGSGPLALPDGARGELLLGSVPPAPGSGGAAGAPVGPASVTVQAVGAGGTVLGERHVSVPAGSTVALALADLLTRGTASVDSGGAPPGLAGVVVRTDDPRIAWASVLVTPRPDGDLVSVLAPVAPQQPRPYVGVRIR